MKDLNGFGGAIPEHFRLLKYYTFAIIVATLINSIYPLWATYYLCKNYDPSDQICLDVGFFIYVDFQQMVQTFQQNNEQQIANTLQILQTTVFYFLLTINFFSIFFLIAFRSEKDKEFEEKFVKDSETCLLFYNIPDEVQDDFPSMLKIFGKDGNINIKKSLKVYKIKSYHENYNHRNEVFYQLQAKYVSSENPYKSKKNKKLIVLNEKLKKEKQEFGKFSGKLVIFF